MGMGAAAVAWYINFAKLGHFLDCSKVIELGSQNMHCPGYGDLLAELFSAMGKPRPSREILSSIADNGASRELYEKLGFQYHSVDTDGNYGAVKLDLNFDTIPENWFEYFDVVTNFGTAEHILNQMNVFRSIHDLVRPGGLMLHIAPFLGCLDHGFFNFQPNFFEALARFNSYDILGIWVNVDTSIPTLIPWNRGMFSKLSLASTSDTVLFVALRKKFSGSFLPPIQGIYEEMTPDDVMARYTYMVDGNAVNGLQARYLQNIGSTVTLSPTLAELKQLQMEINSLRNSTSWKITAPLRRLFSKLRSLNWG